MSARLRRAAAIVLAALLTAAPAAVRQDPVQPAAVDAQYWCAMHPDQRSARPGVCPICRMPFVRMPPARFVTYPVDLRATPTLRGARLRLAVRSPASGAVIRRFAIVHERSLHLFVVGDGLQFFAHEHPAQQPDGTFMIDLALPRPGPYMAIAEFTPEGATAQTFQQLFTTAGAVDASPIPGVDIAPKAIDGMNISMDASALRAGQASRLEFRVHDPSSGAAIADLEPYLGARAHLLMVSSDLTEAMHGHPDASEAALAFLPIVPRAGRYKLWLQVQRGGRVTTASFVVDVPGS